MAQFPTTEAPVGLQADDISLNGTNHSIDCAHCPPVHLFSDFIEMIYLGLVISIGTPANIYILHQLIRELRHTPKNSVRAGFLLMKINLNISDLLILIVLALGKLTWLATYAWYGGALLCKLFNYLSMVALYISSNVIVCIAMDRLRNVLGANKVRRGRHTVQPVKIMLFFAWLLASLWSLPQLHVWDTLNVFPEWPGGWTQCSDMWSIRRFNAFQNNLTDFDFDELSQNIYDITHLVAVFWGPLIMLIILYSIIAVRVLQYSIRPTFQESPNLNGTFASPTPNEHNSRSPRYSMVSTGMPLAAMMMNGSTLPNSGKETTLFTQSESDNEGVIRLKPRPIGSATAQASSNLLTAGSMHQTLVHTDSRQSNGGLLQVPLEASLERRRSSLVERLLQLRAGLNRNRVPRSSEDSAYGDAADVGGQSFDYGGGDSSSRRSLVQRLRSSIRRQRSHTDPAGADSRSSHRGPPRPRLPAWRKQLRSKVFRTTLLVVLAHVLFWLPYNFYALMKYMNADWYAHMSEHANVFKDLQILITLINPFLYGFTQ